MLIIQRYAVCILLSQYEYNLLRTVFRVRIEITEILIKVRYTNIGSLSSEQVSTRVLVLCCVMSSAVLSLTINIKADSASEAEY